MSQVDLGKRCGLSASHLSEIERGVILPTIPSLQKIAQALDRPLEYFFQEKFGAPRSFGMVFDRTSIGGQAVIEFTKLLEKSTGGDMKLRIYHSAALGSARDQVEALKAGAMHFYIDEPHCFAPFAPLCDLVYLPFFFRERPHYHRFLQSTIFKEHIVDRLLKNGIRILNPASNWELGSFMVLFSTHPLYCPEDLRDRKFRSNRSEAAIALRQALGAEPIVVEWEHVFRAFESGEIDTLLVPAGYFAALKLYRVARYATVLYMGYTLNLTVAVNEHEFSKLSPKMQEALLEACEVAGTLCAQLANKHTEADLTALSETHGLPVIQPDTKLWRSGFISAIKQVCKTLSLDKNLLMSIQDL